MRTMALDFGERRIGVAVTDPTGATAQPLETIARAAGRPEAAFGRLAELIAAYEVERIVVGLPLHMDGRSGRQAQLARAFGDEVARRTGVPVDYLDERWTTREAERVLAEAGARGRKRRSQLDPIAAAILLRTYLERAAQ